MQQIPGSEGGEEKIANLKKELMKSISGTNAGQTRVTPQQQQSILGIIKDLANLNPTADPIRSPLVCGTWALLYSTPNDDDEAVDKYAGSFEGPFLARLKPLSFGRVRRKGVTQVIDTAEKRLDNVARFTAFGLPGVLNVCGEYEESAPIPDRGRVRLSVTFTSFVLSVADKFKITVPLSLFNPQGWVDTLYLDDDTRIVLGDKGTIFVTSRIQRI